jgi:hypothetical protein
LFGKLRTLMIAVARICASDREEAVNYPKPTVTKAQLRGLQPHQPHVLMDIHDVEQTLRLGRTKIEELTKAGKLGEVIYLGKRSKRWKASAVLAYANSGDVA